eukprot:scaffold1141_cov128-Isochrysis_galbana.AAC.11
MHHEERGPARTVDHVCAQLVRLHVHQRGVGRDVDLRDDVEEEGLLDARAGDEDVEQVFEGGELRNQLLHHLGEGLKDGVVVDRREVEVHLDLCGTGNGTCVCSGRAQESLHSCKTRHEFPPGVALAAHVLQARSRHLFVEMILQLALAFYPLVLTE